MAVELSSLPNQVQNKIKEMITKITVIQQILSHSYPSGETEIEVIGIDTEGRNCCRIFSYLEVLQ